VIFRRNKGVGSELTAPESKAYGASRTRRGGERLSRGEVIRAPLEDAGRID